MSVCRYTERNGQTIKLIQILKGYKMIKKYDWIRIIQFSSILSRELEYIKQYTFNLKLVCEKREFYFIFFCQSFVKIQSKLIYFNL